MISAVATIIIIITITITTTTTNFVPTDIEGMSYSAGSSYSDITFPNDDLQSTDKGELFIPKEFLEESRTRCK